MSRAISPNVSALATRIEHSGGVGKIFDMIEDGLTITQVARTYGSRRGVMLRLLQSRVDWAKRLEEAQKARAVFVVEDAFTDLGDAVPETAHLRKTQFDSALKLAGVLDRETFGEKPTAAVTVNINSLHLQAVKQVREERIQLGQAEPALIEGEFTETVADVDLLS